MSKTQKLLWILIFGLFSVNLLYAQTNKLNNNEGNISMPQSNTFGVPNEIQSKINIFFRHIFKEQFKDAYKVILKDSELSENTKKVDKLIEETKRIKKYYGKLTGYEFVNSEAITKSYIRVRCLGLCTDYPMRWLFTYYKSPKAGWIITNIKFDDLSEYYFSD